MIKIEVNTNQDIINLKCDVKRKGCDLTKEIYVILKHFDTNYPEQMMVAVAKIVDDYKGALDG